MIVRAGNTLCGVTRSILGGTDHIVDFRPSIPQQSATLKLAPYLFTVFIAMVLPLHAQIVTGHSTSLTRRSSPTFSLQLDWNESGGLDGAISRVHPITGFVFDTITGAGAVQSRLVSIQFPGHGNFRGRMSRDGSLITGRLLFRESPSSRTLVRRFTLYSFAPTSTTGASMTMELLNGAAAIVARIPLTNVVVQSVSP